MSNMIVIADPRFQIHYVSYYLVGIKEIGYSLKYHVIQDFPLKSYSQLTRGMAFTCNGKKYFFDVNDPADIDEYIYEWCDVYAKINLTVEDANRDKIVALGPSFSVRVASPISTLWMGIRNYIKAQKGWNELIRPNLLQFMKGYLYTLYRRRYFSDYIISKATDSEYVFSMNTLWYDNLTFNTTNRLRILFVRVCKKVMPKFEGGFFYIGGKSVVKEFPKYEVYLDELKDVLFTKRIGMLEYLEKTKRSAFVFNTPAVGGCHGWKLGEYIVLGKAIISTPLSHVMPGNFKKNVHYVEVNSDEEMEQAVLLLYKDVEMRNYLSNNIKEYYKNYISPVASIKRIMS